MDFGLDFIRTCNSYSYLLSDLAGERSWTIQRGWLDRCTNRMRAYCNCCWARIGMVVNHEVEYIPERDGESASW